MGGGQNLHGWEYTHTNLKSRRTDLYSRSLGANPKVLRGHAQKGYIICFWNLEFFVVAYELYTILDHKT